MRPMVVPNHDLLVDLVKPLAISYGPWFQKFNRVVS
jgi:hypothetical protein